MKWGEASDHTVVTAARLIWEDRQRLGHWPPEAMGCARELLRRGFVELSAKKVTIVDFGRPMDR